MEDRQDGSLLEKCYQGCQEEEKGNRYLEVLSFGKKGTMITLEGAVSS